jgi:uncharacterized membrane protein
MSPGKRLRVAMATVSTAAVGASPDSGRQVTTQRPLGRALAGHRRVRLGLLQLAYIAVAAVLGALLPRIQVGSAPADRVSQLLFATAAGVLPLLGIVYSLLFLVVQWGHSMFTPRLNLFRDHPVVWHAFGFFTAVFVFMVTAAFNLGDGPEASALVPWTATLLVLVAVSLIRIVMTTAFNSIQLGPTLRAVAGRGARVIDGVYPQPFDPQPAAPTGGAEPSAPTRTEVLWPHPWATLQRIDVARLVGMAARTDCVVEFRVGVGQVVREGRAFAAIRGSGPAALSPAEVVDCVVAGPERTFDQDPALAIRVLVDIALRALSPAVNDPSSAAQALDAIQACLERLAARDLDIVRIAGVHGHERLRLVLPSWQEYVALAFDELLVAGPSALQVARRLVEVLSELVEVVPPARRTPLQRRLERATDDLHRTFPDEARATS